MEHLGSVSNRIVPGTRLYALSNLCVLLGTDFIHCPTCVYTQVLTKYTDT